MKAVVILIFTYCLNATATELCLPEDFSKNISQKLPKGTEEIVYRIVVCNYWPNNESSKEVRSRHKCSSLEKDKKTFLAKNKNSDKINGAFKRAAEWTSEDGCQ